MLSIQLLGKARIDREGAAAAGPRGNKAWGVLVYLIVSRMRAPSREHLAELLFAEADDPLGSLRWNLSELRRALGPAVLPPGSHVLEIPPGCRVDTDLLTRGTAEEALSLPGLGRELLEGMDFSASPAFEAWLLLERRRLIGAAQDVLNEAALDRLAGGRPAEAAAIARRLVELDPYDEGFQALLVRSYAQAGDKTAALRQVDACTALFVRELGRQPSVLLQRAVDEPPLEPDGAATRLTGVQIAGALLEAGEAAARAGAAEGALQSLRRAAATAREAGARELEARAELALGSTLVHAVRGRDNEGASSLMRAAALGAELQLEDVRATAITELAYVDVLAGRYARCERRLETAAAAASSDSEHAAVHAVFGMALSDRGAHEKASEHFTRSLRHAQRAGDRKQTAFTLSFIGRSQIATGHLDAARETLDRSLALTEDDAWLAFKSWPETWRAEVDLLTGDLAAARRRLEHAFALGCEFDDPCWEGIAGRGLGLLLEQEGDIPGALRRLEDTRQRAARLPDSYVWVQAAVLEALAAVAVRAGSRRAPGWVEDLHSLAARTGAQELAVQAYLHRAALGDPSAREAARVMAAEVENPALHVQLQPA